MRVWRKSWQKLHPCFLRCKGPRREVLMCWMAIKADGTSLLLQCPHKLNASHYQEDVLQQALPFLKKKVFNNTPIFAQDNAPCHVARSTLEWFRKHHVQLLQGFPPYSPDINIMENCWAVMAKEMEGCYAPNKHVLWDHIQKAHKKITVTYIEKLYASLKPRLEAIITAKGGHTKY